MAEKTVTVGDQEVQIEETDDGFEVQEVPDTPSAQFERETGISPGDSLAVGAVDRIEDRSGAARVYVSDSDWDIMAKSLDDARNAGWYPNKIEFEYGWVNFVKPEGE